MDNKLEAIQKIIEVGSFTKAAEILGYTQSAISQMISSLEKEMSIKLLYRSKRGGAIDARTVKKFIHLFKNY